ncbi:MAG: hypothetical protein HONBIEJF_01993 [Fimbriimonadaceae bacterium]|nr:hypothetical protein [Fimbriimonadaceae bacterium]
MVLLAVLTSLAIQQRSLTFETSLKSVAIFRDGFGYYVREGQVKLENGWATTNFVPAAVRGTIYFYTLDKGDRIDTVITTKDNRLEFGSPAELRTKLSDKIGLRLVVTTSSGQRFEGELAKLLDDMLLLQVGQGYSAVPYAQIAAISLPGFPVKLKIDGKDPNKLTRLGVAYLQDGIRWEPSYVLNVSGSTANLQLRATLHNTTESLSKSEVLFVVGSPFVSNRGIPDIFGTSAVPVDANKGVEAPAAKSPERPGTAESGGSAAPPPMAAIAGEEAGELYFYRKPNLSLATNDIAMVSIFQQDVPISPSFDWNADGEEVIYLLNIKNVTKQPLTTGPVFVIEDGKAVGQETIRYTPAEGSAELRLSRGIGLRVEKTEAEQKRGSAVRIGRSDFVPVTLKGTLSITNFRTTAAEVRVTKTVRGKVVSQSHGGTIRNTQTLSGEVNPINDLLWKVKLTPGETVSITYNFETLMFSDRSGTPPVPEKPDGG